MEGKDKENYNESRPLVFACKLHYLTATQLSAFLRSSSADFTSFLVNCHIVFHNKCILTLCFMKFFKCE